MIRYKKKYRARVVAFDPNPAVRETRALQIAAWPVDVYE